MDLIFTAGRSADAVPIWFVTGKTYAELRERLDEGARTFADAAGFEPKAGRHLLLPARSGLGGVLFGLDDPDEARNDPFLPGRLPQILPDGVYRFANEAPDPRLAALAFALGSYRFTRYRKPDERELKLDLPQSLDRDELVRIVEAVTLARDLINTPANDMGPQELETAAGALAARHGAKMSAIVGENLLAENFPLIHAVGRASVRGAAAHRAAMGRSRSSARDAGGQGRLLRFGRSRHQARERDVADEEGHGRGGERAGARAHDHGPQAQGAAAACSSRRSRTRFPAPLSARATCTGRARGSRSRSATPTPKGGSSWPMRSRSPTRSAPELLIDMGTLTGAARVALGPEMPPFYTADDALAAAVASHAAAENDPLWRLPLWQPYDTLLEFKVADLNNVGTGSFAGSIVCALFLKRFVEAAKAWLHVDIYAWTPTAKPGRPEGGECQAARALYALLAARYG